MHCTYIEDHGIGSVQGTERLLNLQNPTTGWNPTGFFYHFEKIHVGKIHFEKIHFTATGWNPSGNNALDFLPLLPALESCPQTTGFVASQEKCNAEPEILSGSRMYIAVTVCGHCKGISSLSMYGYCQGICTAYIAKVCGHGQGIRM